MFFCEECRIKNNWPKGMVKSIGPCEICGKQCECYNVPSSRLPRSIPGTARTYYPTTGKEISEVVDGTKLPADSSIGHEECAIQPADFLINTIKEAKNELIQNMFTEVRFITDDDMVKGSEKLPIERIDVIDVIDRDIIHKSSLLVFQRGNLYKVLKSRYTQPDDLGRVFEFFRQIINNS